MSTFSLRLRRSRVLTLAFPIALFLVALGVIAIPVHRAIEARRFEITSKETLLDIQRALQDYHVAEEIYPRRSPLTGAQLVQLLIESGHLERPPLNPWTRLPYRFEDPAQPDGITYHTDELAETYALESTDLALTPDAPLWQLDSTTHHSLE